MEESDNIKLPSLPSHCAINVTCFTFMLLTPRHIVIIVHTRPWVLSNTSHIVPLSRGGLGGKEIKTPKKAP